jgi:hypothetical protein
VRRTSPFGFGIALLLLALCGAPLFEGHHERALGSPVAEGHLVAVQASHPGATEHVEASTVEVSQPCPTCESAPRRVGEVETVLGSIRLERIELAVPAAPAVRGGVALATPAVRGPPSLSAV